MEHRTAEAEGIMMVISLIKPEHGTSLAYTLDRLEREHVFAAHALKAGRKRSIRTH
jgi:hypothetical protein